MIVFGFTFEALVDDTARFAIDLELDAFPVAVIVDVVAGFVLTSKLVDCADGFVDCAFVPDVPDNFLSSFCMGIKYSLSSSWLFEQFNNLDFGIMVT